MSRTSRMGIFDNMIHTVSPRIYNVHALILEDAPSFREQVHALICTSTKNIFRKKACTYIRT